MLRKNIKKINHYIQYIAGITLLGLMLLTVADVTLRALLNRPIPGTYELSWLILTFIVFFAVGYAQDYKEHVVIDLLYDHLPRKGKRFFSYLSTIIYLAIVLLMCVVVFNYGLKLISTGAETPILKIPQWPTVIIAAVGLASYALSVIGDLLFLKEGGVLSNDAD